VAIKFLPLNADLTELKANEQGSVIEIVKNVLLSDNFYTCNSDGYIGVECGNNTSNYCTVLIYSATLDRSSASRVVGGSQDPIQLIYVRKGMRVKVPSAYGTWVVTFRPFE
jgi:hypothetical protein